jgi:hypothetical protein
LVDDATVEIENIHRNLAMGKPLQQAILDGAQQIAVPAFVATLAICIVFVSVVFLTGPAKYLFTPLALAVVYAMLASYVLSRTLVPVLAKYLLHGEEHGSAAHAAAQSARKSGRVGFFTRFQRGFEHGYEGLRGRDIRTLHWGLATAWPYSRCSGRRTGQPGVVPFIGRDFFHWWMPARCGCTYRAARHTPGGDRSDLHQGAERDSRDHRTGGLRAIDG